MPCSEWATRSRLRARGSCAATPRPSSGSSTPPVSTTPGAGMDVAPRARRAPGRRRAPGGGDVAPWPAPGRAHPATTAAKTCSRRFSPASEPSRPQGRRARRRPRSRRTVDRTSVVAGGGWTGGRWSGGRCAGMAWPGAHGAGCGAGGEPSVAGQGVDRGRGLAAGWEAVGVAEFGPGGAVAVVVPVRGDPAGDLVAAWRWRGRCSQPLMVPAAWAVAGQRPTGTMVAFRPRTSCLHQLHALTLFPSAAVERR